MILYDSLLLCMILHSYVRFCMILYGSVWLFIIILHSYARFCMILYCYVWFCIVMHDSVWFCMVLYDSLSLCMILHSYAQFCMILCCSVWYYMIFIAMYDSMILHSYVWFCVVLYDSVWLSELTAIIFLIVMKSLIFQTVFYAVRTKLIPLITVSHFRQLKAATNGSLRARQDRAAWHTACSHSRTSQLGHQSAGRPTGSFISSSITNQVQLCYTVLSCFLETKKYQPIGCLATAWKQQPS
jgi:hypothetical protein